MTERPKLSMVSSVRFDLMVSLRARSVGSFFSIEDHDKVAHLMKQHFSLGLESKEIPVKGWNWGTTDFQGRSTSCPVRTFSGLKNVSGQDLAFLV